MADLDEIMSGGGGDSATEQTPAVEQSTEGQPRDEQGRFAPQEQPTEQAAPAAVDQQEQRPPEGYIPIQALDARLAKLQERHDAALRERDLSWQRQLEALRQPPKPVEPAKQPDYFENPDAAVDFRLQQAIQPVQQGQQAIVENFSRMIASDKFGEDAVNAALTEMTTRVQSNPQGMRFDYQRIMSSPHPYGELVKWHKAQSALSEIGDDPKAFREKVRAEILAEMNGGQPQPQPQASQKPDQPIMPTNFSGARNAGPTSAPAFTGPLPLSEIMGGR